MHESKFSSHLELTAYFKGIVCFFCFAKCEVYKYENKTKQLNIIKLLSVVSIQFFFIRYVMYD